ncbi:MAG: HDIG domain-containing protein [Synergistaceae bacterium]|jgi:putative nucleotidyltransferase with HDIG domain|nr:HDIG domain-containing protein [Synergistaceae bacterium]
MDKIPRHSFLKWLRGRVYWDKDKRSGDGPHVTYWLFQLSLVLASVMIVMFGWFFIDRNESYRVGYPSPRVYLAQSSARFLDEEATADQKERASGQIVDVRVRDFAATAMVEGRIAALRDRGSIDFAPAQLVDLVDALPSESRAGLLAVVQSVAEENFDKSVNVSEQSARIWDSLRGANLSQADKNLAYQLLEALLTPTVVEDQEMAGRLRREVSGGISPVVREIRLGSVIAERGQVVTPEIARILRSQGYPDAAIPWKHLAFVVLAVLAWSTWLTWIADKMGVALKATEWTYVAVLLIIDWGAQRWFVRWSIDSLSVLALTGWLFLTIKPALAFHIALGGSLLGYLLAFPGMTYAVAVGCIVCGVASGASFMFIKEASSRIMIWRNIFSLGLFITAASLFIRWGFGLPVSLNVLVAYLLLCAFWSSIVVAVLPLWESVFEMLSPLRLLEMSHPSQPLLKRLQLEAPGTYHHTITVGTLVEAVADRLGMNGLLVRTGAYYHDIGKLKRPHYFVENQSFGDNIHDRLAPRDSARIILQHVKDGMDMAGEYKLPEGIKRFIEEHHGRTFLSYFYNKAVAADKEQGGDGSGIDKADFTYPGPTPQSRETALLMLADSTEAALKSLDKPLSGRPDVEKLVESVMDSKMASGQFMDVDFTLKELNAIKTAFIEVLMSMYHTREIKPIASADEEETKRHEAAGAPDKSAAVSDAPAA